MTFVSFAQNFEDVRLWRAFSDVAQGRYLDIGAQDPVHDSVSHAFYLHGWRGVHVEPTPAFAAAMRAARPDETIIEAAVSTAGGPIKFFEIPATGLSTGIAGIAEGHTESGWSANEITVPTVTLAGLFDLMGDGPIHWLKIDVEGMEADVISSWGEHPARPIALVIEATEPTKQVQSHQQWHAKILSRGYRDVLFDGLSRYFIHEDHIELGKALALSPNVFDGFHVGPSHFTAGKVVAQMDEAVATTRQQAEAASEQAKAELEKNEAERQHAEADLDRANAELEKAEAERRQTEAELHKAVAERGRLENDLQEICAQSERAEAAHKAELSAIKAEADTKLLDAATTAAARTEKAIEAARDEADARVKASDRALADLRAQLTEQQHANIALHGKAERLEGELLARIELNAARIADLQLVRRDLASRLKATEKSFSAAIGQVAELKAELQWLARDRDQARCAATKQEALTAAARDREAELAQANTHLAQQVSDLTGHSNSVAAQFEHATGQIERLHSELGSMQAHIAWREGQLRHASALLNATPDIFAELSAPWQYVVRRVARGDQFVARKEHSNAVADWHAQAMLSAANETTHEGNTSAHDSFMTTDAAFIQKELGTVDHEGPITSVPRLLEPHDRQFIHAAYQAVLGRAPDAEGEAYYLGRLRTGVHKLTILKQLRRSAEGREFIPGVAGLDRAIRRYRWATLPLIGAMLRVFGGPAGNSATHRQLRVLENEIGRIQSSQEGLAQAIHQLLDRPAATPPTAAAPPPPEPAHQLPQKPTPPVLEIGEMPENLDSRQRRLLVDLRFAGLSRGAFV